MDIGPGDPGYGVFGDRLMQFRRRLFEAFWRLIADAFLKGVDVLKKKRKKRVLLLLPSALYKTYSWPVYF